MSSSSVLLIDPDPASSKLASILLRSAGWIAVVAQTAAAAEQVLLAIKPSVIVMELVLPDVDGLEFVTHLRTDARTGDVPIVVATALNGPDTEYRARTAGAVDLIRKPIDITTFAARVTAVAHQGKP